MHDKRMYTNMSLYKYLSIITLSSVLIMYRLCDVNVVKAGDVQ